MLRCILERNWLSHWVRSAVVGLAPAATVFSAEVAFQRHVINAHTDYSAAAVSDVNQDGKLDILCGGDWYEAPHWERHYVRDVPRIRGRPDGFAHLTLDVNRDGWDDVITVNYRSASIKWVEHPGGQLGPWKTHVVARPGPMETGRLIDVDQDGQVDLLPNGARFAAWWELRWPARNQRGEPQWLRHELPLEAGGHGLGFGDIDGDGRGDLVGQFGWLKAPADRRKGRWYWNPEFRLERASIPMIVADVDDDGDADILWTSAHGFGIYWLEQNKVDGVRSWTRHAIDPSWSQAHAPLWVDVDGDGRNELVAGKRFMSHGGSDPGAYDPLVVYRYQFEPGRGTWRRWMISSGERVGFGLDPKAVDMDGDGDLDFVASGRSGLYLLENLGQRQDVPQATPARATRVGGEPSRELLLLQNVDGERHPVSNRIEWGRRRSQILTAIHRSIGPLPSTVQRCPLKTRLIDEQAGGPFVRRTIEYQVMTGQRVVADVWEPRGVSAGNAAGVVCVFDAMATANAAASHLTQQGFVCLVPHPDHDLADGKDELREQLWRTMRGLDVLQSLPAVHGERLACVGDRMGGQIPLLLAGLDPRCLVAVAAGAVAFETPTNLYHGVELLAAVAPRSISVRANGELQSRALDAAADRAARVFQLCKSDDNLRVEANSEIGTLDVDGYRWLEERLPPTR